MNSVGIPNATLFCPLVVVFVGTAAVVVCGGPEVGRDGAVVLGGTAVFVGTVVLGGTAVFVGTVVLGGTAVFVGTVVLGGTAVFVGTVVLDGVVVFVGTVVCGGIEVGPFRLQFAVAQLH